MSPTDPNAVEHIPSEAASTYAKVADAYGQAYYQSVADAVAGRLSSSCRILDAGTGPGFLPLLVAERTDDTRIDAFDFTCELVTYGRTQAKQRGVDDRVSFFVGDCYTLPVPGTTYPILTCTGVLHSLEDPVGALREFYRVLTPGGTALVFDPAVFDVPEDPDIDLTDHERAVFETYGIRAADDTPPLSVAEAQRLVDSTPFDTATIEEGELGDVRMYLGRGE